jgi:hypothetical protein
MISLQDMLKEADRSYSVVRQHPMYGAMFASEDGRRERFQLLAAALVYSRSALLRFQTASLHATGDPMRSPAAWICDPTALDDDASAEIRAGMDSASSSFRIATALELAHPSFVKRTSLLLTHLATASSMECRERSAKSLSGEQCRAVLVAHRDSFGHGEEGNADTPWIRQRHMHFVKVCHCRIIEAQLGQIRIGLDELQATL